MADQDCWGAFGSDSDSEEDEANATANGVRDPCFAPAADATALAITQHFASLAKSSGVALRERVVGIGGSSPSRDDDDGREKTLQETMRERVGGRGMTAVMAEGAGPNRSVAGGGDFLCDAAIVLQQNTTDRGQDRPTSKSVKRALVPGGRLWLMLSLTEEAGLATAGEAAAKEALEDWSEAVWDVAAASCVYASSAFRVLTVRKRPCVINAWSCPWMDKQQKIGTRQLATLRGEEACPLSAQDTHLHYERHMASAVTVTPSVAERTQARGDGTAGPATVLTAASVANATAILQRHGVVVVKGLLPPSQTLPWGAAALSDFEAAVARLKCHPTRPVELLNPHTATAAVAGGDAPTPAATPGEARAFEPVSYKEMAMREDLRVDLRAGPRLDALRRARNRAARAAMAGAPGTPARAAAGEEADAGPTLIAAEVGGTAAHWRFHPSLLAIIRAVFNPRDEALSEGNFGRWNFGGAGPDGSPQPFRLGQIGSVLSCPGSGDQAIHADTPHLFEHADCLPCHYLNVFTPGYEVVNDPDGTHFRNEFDDDGNWTGNSTLGGTAFVHGSHRLSATAQLLAEDGAPGADAGDRAAAAALRRRRLQLRTLRPALDAGDAVLFDCRTVHYGLANTSRGDATGAEVHAGRRPTLYLNVSQAWFHDPKNWDDREKIFD